MSCKQKWETGKLTHVCPLLSLIDWVTLHPLFVFLLTVLNFVWKILKECFCIQIMSQVDSMCFIIKNFTSKN